MASTQNQALDSFKDVSRDLLSALGDRALGTIGDRISGLTDRLEDIGDGGPLRKAVEGGGKEAADGGSPVLGGLKGLASGVKDAVTGGSGSSGSPKATKATNIVESIDVGVPVRVAYNQWTEFGSFPSFMKKVESVEAPDDHKLEFKAQIFLSHRRWQATILEQVPDERIVWRSKGEKGHVDGAVTFHELGPNLTRILLVLEYYPQGLFERTGNLWRAQGRRARVEFKHFRRHVMTRTILDPDSVQGWRGEIRDGEVVRSHDEALEEEEQQQDGDEYDEQDDLEPEDDEEPEDEYDEPEDEPVDDYDEAEDEPEDEPEDEFDEPEDEAEPDDELDEEPEDEPDDEPADELEDEPEEERPTRRRRAS